MKKDILFLCQYFYPEYVSSATLPFDTAKALVKAGFTVDVLTGYPGEYCESKKHRKKEIVDSIHVKRVKYLKGKRTKKIGRLINYLSFTLAMFLRTLSLKKYKCIIVYSNPPLLPYLAYLANKLFKVKVVFVCYDVYPEMALETKAISNNGIILKGMNYINNKIFPVLSAVVVLSEDMKEYILINRNISKEKVVVIPNWFKEQNLGEKKNITLTKFGDINYKEKVIVSYLGNLGVAQDYNSIKEMVLSFKNMKDIHFVFSGHGIKMGDLNKMCMDKQIHNISIFGFLKDKDFNGILSISDIFVLSLKENLGKLASPSKLYCYLMAGKPVLAFTKEDTFFGKNINKKGYGYAINPSDKRQIISKINCLLKDKNKRIEMGLIARQEYLKYYETDKASYEYVKLIRNILEAYNV